ncbi:MAG: class II histone deacetylase, partial [Solirubrobacterales bacterium]
VMTGAAKTVFSAMRPPGHHAERTKAMGFCVFNNVAVAARHAQKAHGLSRVAIVDWDVHHGNGTQDIFYRDPDVLFISIHQDGLYPQDLGAVQERGLEDGFGTNVNIPMRAGSGDAGYVAAMEEVVVPSLEVFGPELVILSSGQDAAASDPLGRMSVTTEGFRAMTAKLVEYAESACNGRIVALQEGGYSLDHMPFCVLATVEALAGLEPTLAGDPIEMDVPVRLTAPEMKAIKRARAAQPAIAG